MVEFHRDVGNPLPASLFAVIGIKVGKIAYSQNIHVVFMLIIIQRMIKIYINGIRRFFLLKIKDVIEG